MRLAHDAHVIPPIASSIRSDVASVLIAPPLLRSCGSVRVRPVVVTRLGFLDGYPGVSGVHRELGRADLAVVLEVQVEPVCACTGRLGEERDAGSRLRLAVTGLPVRVDV